MKNTLRIGVLLCVSTLLLVCCSGEVDSFSALDSSLNCTPLFDESDVPIPTTSIDLTEGNWLFKNFYISSTSTPVESTYTLGNDTLKYSFTSLKDVSIQKITVTGGYKITTSKKYRYETGMDVQNKTKYDNFAKAHGITLTWNGTTLINEYSFTYPSVDDYSVTHAIDLAKASYGIAKRNGSGTRYIVKYTWNNNEIFYFAKEQN